MGRNERWRGTLFAGFEYSAGLGLAGSICTGFSEGLEFLSDLYEHNVQQALMTAVFTGFDITVGNTCPYPGLGAVTEDIYSYWVQQVMSKYH